MLPFLAHRSLTQINLQLRPRRTSRFLQRAFLEDIECLEVHHDR